MAAGATETFFAELGERGHEPLLEKARGTFRVELSRGKQTDRWLVAIDRGDVRVSRRNAAADTTIRTSKELFDGVASGEVNVMAAVLRGAIEFEGDPELLVLFQRLFPGPPRKGER
jgi:putative sterol carrier protein